MKERIHYIDITKGILILLLVMTHLSIALKWANIDANHPYFTLWYYPQPLFQVFFMQCFFIVSGFCSNFDINFTTFIQKLGKQLLIPWIFFELIRIAVLAIQGKFSSLILPEYTSLWFLNALIFAKLICWAIHKISKSYYAILILTLILLTAGIALNEFGCGRNIFCYKQGLIDSFFVAVGFTLKKQQRVYDVLLKFSCFIFLVIIGGRFLHLYDLPIQDAGIGVQLSTIPIFLLTSLTGSFACIWCCRRISSNKFLEYYGRNSLIIYGLHMWPYIIIISITSHFFEMETQWNTLVFLFTVYIIEVLLLLFAIELFNCKYLRFLIGRF